jgi:hypothetical protein
VNRTVRTVSDATFVDVVLGSATTCVVEFHLGTDPGLEDGGQEDWLTSLALANTWLSCARLDVTTSPLTAQTYAVGAVPTYLVFQRGAVVSSTTSAGELTLFLQSVTTDPSATPS